MELPSERDSEATRGGPPLFGCLDVDRLEWRVPRDGIQFVIRRFLVFALALLFAGRRARRILGEGARPLFRLIGPRFGPGIIRSFSIVFGCRHDVLRTVPNVNVPPCWLFLAPLTRARAPAVPTTLPGTP